MIDRKKRCIGVCVLIFIFMAGLTVLAADKPKEQKFTGMVVNVPADPGGKLAPVALECKEGVYPLKKNAVAEKIQKKWIGKKLEITGVVEEIDGKKVINPWLMIEAGAKPRPQPTG